MPLYEYECEANGHRFEVIQKFSDPPIAVCPTCGSPVQKLLSSPAIQFKGSGFYITDYARKGDSSTVKAGKAGGSSVGDGASGDVKADAKTETKTETKSETKADNSSAAPTKS